MHGFHVLQKPWDLLWAPDRDTRMLLATTLGFDTSPKGNSHERRLVPTFTWEDEEHLTPNQATRSSGLPFSTVAIANLSL